VPTSNSYRTSKVARGASSLGIVGFHYLLGEDHGMSIRIDFWGRRVKIRV
jgi:hypothetical protein